MRMINEAFADVDAFRKFEQDAGIPSNRQSPVGSSVVENRKQRRERERQERWQAKQVKA